MKSCIFKQNTLVKSAFMKRKHFQDCKFNLCNWSMSFFQVCPRSVMPFKSNFVPFSLKSNALLSNGLILATASSLLMLLYFPNIDFPFFCNMDNTSLGSNCFAECRAEKCFSRVLFLDNQLTCKTKKNKFANKCLNVLHVRNELNEWQKSKTKRTGDHTPYLFKTFIGHSAQYK